MRSAQGGHSSSSVRHRWLFLTDPRGAYPICAETSKLACPAARRYNHGHDEGKIATHAGGKAYDRIIVSDALAKGLNKLKLEKVTIQSHRHGKGEDRRSYTDHFPVIATLRSVP